MGVSPAPEQPEPTHVPEGSATEQPRAAHSLASLAVHELPEIGGRGVQWERWGERQVDGWEGVRRWCGLGLRLTHIRGCRGCCRTFGTC